MFIMFVCFWKWATIIEHYTEYHNVDQENWFFQKLFQPKKKTVFKQCLRCNDFLTIGDHKVRQDFLKHHDQGRKTPFEEKPLDASKFDSLIIYSIEYQKLL